jgi:hypothetical protein
MDLQSSDVVTAEQMAALSPYVQPDFGRERRERAGSGTVPSTRYVRSVLDVNDVNEFDALIRIASTGTAHGHRPRSNVGRTPPGWISQRRRACQGLRQAPRAELRQSMGRNRRRRDLAGASFLHCAVDVPVDPRLHSVVSYIRSASIQPADPSTSVTYERRQSPATTARSQTTCT